MINIVSIKKVALNKPTLSYFSAEFWTKKATNKQKNLTKVAKFILCNCNAAQMIFYRYNEKSISRENYKKESRYNDITQF